MPRKGHVTKRKVSPDPMFRSEAITKFIHSVMYDGKKSVAERIVYGALQQAAKRLNVNPDEVFDKALENVKPLIEVRPRRVGGATYQVPVEVAPDRAQALAIRWIINSARSRKGIPMTERLAREFVDAYKGEGAAVKKREDTHKMAEANRAFAHYRW
ncbi:MAG TPA: 30S ribosomal protein S7 [Acetomicrobium flavidum]|uniref:Small ribosomal subunit protein uS7 n=2 Tax=Acetomicrobium TaxID=49894 RepID=I4BV17_ACEMN|nr:30S ribosomal protein S7 [Acetomicrobium mobile]SIN64624.1 SSU ribosomal protein S7P [Acetomicrobium flavidum]AFM21124.1 ribosomal protein S7, bacterial/organelle [Acetomicrobium mobile DSM 13181]HOJ81871.1 30S ribosomal protein S7 [Acetomicrobium flavidum]HOM30583.1 30S ribosomal protein S7 [Acetomicrobium flavidum]HOP87401.1 30S ribosomal protein S7 [Acetomicrobium flavidum]